MLQENAYRVVLSPQEGSAVEAALPHLERWLAHLRAEYWPSSGPVGLGRTGVYPYADAEVRVFRPADLELVYCEVEMLRSAASRWLFTVAAVGSAGGGKPQIIVTSQPEREIRFHAAAVNVTPFPALVTSLLNDPNLTFLDAGTTLGARARIVEADGLADFLAHAESPERQLPIVVSQVRDKAQAEEEARLIEQRFFAAVGLCQLYVLDADAARGFNEAVTARAQLLRYRYNYYMPGADLHGDGEGQVRPHTHKDSELPESFEADTVGPICSSSSVLQASGMIRDYASSQTVCAETAELYEMIAAAARGAFEAEGCTAGRLQAEQRRLHESESDRQRARARQASAAMKKISQAPAPEEKKEPAWRRARHRLHSARHSPALRARTAGRDLARIAQAMVEASGRALRKSGGAFRGRLRAGAKNEDTSRVDPRLSKNLARQTEAKAEKKEAASYDRELASGRRFLGGALDEEAAARLERELGFVSSEQETIETLRKRVAEFEKQIEGRENEWKRADARVSEARRDAREAREDRSELVRQLDERSREAEALRRELSFARSELEETEQNVAWSVEILRQHTPSALQLGAPTGTWYRELMAQVLPTLDPEPAAKARQPDSFEQIADLLCPDDGTTIECPEAQWVRYTGDFREIGQIPENTPPAVVHRVWNYVRALAAYAEAQSEGKARGGLKQFLQTVPIAHAATDYKARESAITAVSDELREMRTFPVDADVTRALGIERDYMQSHFGKGGRGDPVRVHFGEYRMDNGQVRICIGYIGPHLKLTSTN